MSPEEFKAYSHESYHALEQLNELLEKRFKIGTWQRWDYDLDSATLTFSSDGIPRVSATIQALGSTSSKSGTWMWGWANPGLPGVVTDKLHLIREFGQRENLSQLTEGTFPGDEDLGWQLAAVATRILGAQGVYRCPSRNGHLFLALVDVCFVESDKKSEPRRAEKRAEIQCATHATAFATFVCEHLASNPAQVWFSEAPTEENPWPNAWCAKCHEIFEEQGQWNEKNEECIKIKLLCHRCYALARARAVRTKPA